MFGSVLFLALFETTLSISKNLPQICENVTTFTCAKPEKLIPWTECGEYLPACDAKRCCTDKMIQVDTHWHTTVYRSNVHVDARGSDGWSLLASATARGDADIAARLIARNASVNLQTNGNQDTALILAARMGRADLVKMLLQANASTAITNRLGENSMMRAALWGTPTEVSGRMQVIELLRDYCAEASEWSLALAYRTSAEEAPHLSRAQNNPLIAAVLRESTDGLSRILQNPDMCMNGTSINSTETTDEGEWTALTHATNMSNLEMVDILLEHKAQIGMELEIAAKKGFLEIGKKLLGEGTNVGAENDAAIVAAVENNHTDFVHFLLEKGASANAKDKSAKTVLMLAATKNNDIVKRLLKSSEIEVNAMDKDGQSALMFAAETCFVDSVKSFVDDCRINVNSSDKSGQTALMLAAHCPANVVELLLNQGRADVNARDHQGRSALLQALKHAVNRCAPDVVSFGPQGSLTYATTRMHSVEPCKVDVVYLLLSHPSIQINAKSGEGTASMMAFEAIDRLLSHPNMSVAPTVSKHDSALFRAARKNRTDIVKSLLPKNDRGNVDTPGVFNYWELGVWAFLLVPFGLLFLFCERCGRKTPVRTSA